MDGENANELRPEDEEAAANVEEAAEALLAALNEDAAERREGECALCPGRGLQFAATGTHRDGYT